MIATLWWSNLVFLTLALACLAWAQWRTRPGPAFPGPRPVGRLFRGWLVVIWLAGAALPLFALMADGFAGGERLVRTALGLYFLMFMAQIAAEMWAWKARRSPVWVIVPCLFLPWRLFQVGQGWWATAPLGLPLTDAAWAALAVLWVINIGVHYSNIPNSLRWDAHPADARFPALGGRP